MRRAIQPLAQVRRLTPALRRFLVDLQLYGYELATALIVRILQLSLPDENTAMLIGLAGAILDVGTRIFSACCS